MRDRHGDRLFHYDPPSQHAHTREILPRGSHSVLRERLRQERQKEYAEYMRDRDDTTRTRAPPIKNLSEARRQLQRERDHELTASSSTTSLRARKLADEKQYRAGSMPHNDRTTAMEGKPAGVRFAPPLPLSTRWEEEEEAAEEGLAQWARGQRSGTTTTTRQRAATPQALARHAADDPLRSISAPVVVPEGIVGLGVRDSTVRRERQKSYAEELRAQIREREAGKVKVRAHNIVPSQKDSPPRHRSPAKSNSQTKYRSPPKKHDYEDDNRAANFHHPRAGYDRYSMYPPPPPPPPPPHPQSYPGGPYWGPPHFQYPPHMDFGSYYPPPLPPNPYYPPPLHYSDRHSQYREDDRPRGGRSRFMDDEPVASRFEGRSRPQFVEKRGRESGGNSHDEDEFTSPLHGKGGHTPRQDKNTYRTELEQQMREKKEREKKEKSAKVKYEKKHQADVYDPWGKGGCGAPVKDQHGNLVADLRKMKKINDDVRQSLSPSGTQEIVLSYNTDGEEQKKSEQNSYRDYLQQQVKEKEQLKQKEKVSKMAEEQRELDKIELERLKLEEKFKREREGERAIELESRNKNERTKKEVEERRRQLAIQQQEERVKEIVLEKQAIEEKRRALAEKMEQPYMPQRSRSPPIPTLRSKTNQQQQQQANPPQTLANQPPAMPSPAPGSPLTSYSPPVPALRSTSQTQQPTAAVNVQAKPSDIRMRPPPMPVPSNVEPAGTSRSGSADVLSQLAAMRKHLQAELSREVARPAAHKPPAPPHVRQPAAVIQRELSLGKENSFLSSESTQMPLSIRDPFQPPQMTRPPSPGPRVTRPPSFGTRVSRPPSSGSRLTRPHPSSAGGQSQFSVTTYDVDSMARRNEERMRRLDAILNAGSTARTEPPSSSQDPQVILHNFLSKTNRLKMTSRPSEKSLQCETQHITSNI